MQLGPCTTAAEPVHPKACAPQQERPLQQEARAVQLEWSHSLQLEKACVQQWKPSTAPPQKKGDGIQKKSGIRVWKGSIHLKDKNTNLPKHSEYDSLQNQRIWGKIYQSKVNELDLPINIKKAFRWASLIAQLVKNPPAMQETLVQFLGREDPLAKG